MLPDNASNLDPAQKDARAAVSDAADTVSDMAASAVSDISDLVVRNPVPAALIAAATGAGLMALLGLMSRSSDPYPPTTIPVGRGRGLDYDALKQQISDLADRIGKSFPTDAAKQRVEDSTDALADTWSGVRDQALDVLGKLQPQATAAVKMARENPLWTAVVMGAVGALLGSQLLGKGSGGNASS